MLIIGAGGFAKELLEIFQQKKTVDNIAFYDDVNQDAANLVFNRYPLLKNDEEAKHFFSTNGSGFTIGIGNPVLRHKLYERFISLGGQLNSVISPKANIGSNEVIIGDGCNILDGAIMSNCTYAGIGCIIYYNAIITHNSRLGNFVQISPAVNILGAGIIDDYTMIGANATILPKVRVGKYALVGAGSVVTKPVADYALIMGNPARQTGWVSEYGEKLLFDKKGNATCKISNENYFLKNHTIEKII